MKLVAPLLLVAFALSSVACNTVVTRRDLYSPSEGGGYWTKRYTAYTREEGLAGVSKPDSHRRPSGKPMDDEGLFGISRPAGRP